MKFSEYCASFITPQMTLLEKFNALIRYLSIKENEEVLVLNTTSGVLSEEQEQIILVSEFVRFQYSTGLNPLITLYRMRENFTETQNQNLIIFIANVEDVSYQLNYNKSTKSYTLVVD